MLTIPEKLLCSVLALTIIATGCYAASLTEIHASVTVTFGKPLPPVASNDVASIPQVPESLLRTQLPIRVARK